MGRRENPVDPAAGPVQRFAYDLRKLRQEAGGLTYRELARRAHYSVTALSQAAAGEQLPSLQVTLAYVGACGGDAEEWERRWQEADREVREAAAGADDGAEPPYQGLARFEPGDHDRFFGRDRLLAALRRRVGERRFTALFGPSGSGKSSLLRAGLIPALRAAREVAAIRVLTPGEHPVRDHAAALEPGGAGDTLVVVDQFEEVFTLCRDPDERRAFIDLLLTACGPQSRLRVVIAVRADFYGRCAEHRALADALGEAGLLVGPMEPGELREVIVKPAQAEGLIVERALTSLLVDEVAGEPGGLPLLSHVLRETWRRRRGRALTMEAYEAAGGIRGAIAQTAEDVHSSFSAEHARLARLILLRLITPGEGAQDTRRPVDRAELDFGGPAATADVSLVLDRLARARLITLDHDRVDLAHEALITAWPRLSGWIDEEREQLRVHRRLTEAARAWDELGRDPGALYRGTRLAAAVEQLAESSLTPLEQTFLTASRTARRSEVRRRRGLVGALAVLVVLALVAGAVAWQQNRAGDRRRVESEARRVAAVADSMRFSDPVTAMRLSVAAWRLADTTETRSALIAAAAQREQDVLTVPGADSGHSDLTSNELRRLTADGRYVVSVTADRVGTWDLRTHRRTHSGPGPGDLMASGETPAVSPDGRTLAVPTDGSIKLWDVRTARVTGTLGGVALASEAYFSSDGRTLVAEDWGLETDHAVLVWDLRDGRRLLRVQEHGDEMLQAVALSPDGRTLALCTSERGLEMWDTARRRRAAALQAPRARPADCGSGRLVFSPDGRSLALPQDDGVRRWDVRTGRKLPSLEADEVTDARFSPDGDFLVGTGARALYVWRLERTEAPIVTHRLPAGAVSDLAFDRETGALRYLNSTGTVVRTLTLGRALTAPWEKEPAYVTQLSADGRTLARLRDVRGALRLEVVDTRTGRVVFRAPAKPCPDADPEGGVACSDLMALSPDGGYVAFGQGWNSDGPDGADRRGITVWNVRTGRVHAGGGSGRAVGGGWAVNGLALDAHARSLVVYRATDPVSAEVWDLRRSKRVRSVRSRESTGGTSFDSLGVKPALSSDGDRLATPEGVVGDLGAGGRLEHRLLADDMNTAVAFSPDGRYFAAGDLMGRVTLWDGTLRRRLGVLDGQASDSEADLVGTVSALAFSRDGGTLAVGGDAGTVQLWDVASSRLLGSTLPASGDQSLALAFGQDEDTLYAAGVNVPVTRYDLSPEHLSATVCRRTGSGLSPADWRTYIPGIPYRGTC
ncbi:DNA-binding protein [Streptomyces sp. FBKL.4005]|uniref:nSTAND1 domain-containing NTPase n=1 Tax=Streptomyces sp. FBKL.4005 TaxID=2015515 RepID=UPI000B966D4A|nr:DNA-binding protein [Streptomyces sp. FBKL.4005]OYP19886.1 DNA-binding protein [Streptomyces sp. FBKL.4005]